MRDTIFALATPPGRSAIAVMRVSGPQAHRIVGQLSGDKPVNPDRVMRLRRLSRNGCVLDQALVVAFAATGSMTGEPYAELHIHGGAAVTRAVASALSAEGARLAQPGEFSRRALEAGKMDLAQLEGVADLVAAETEAQRAQALRMVDGEASQVVGRWRARLLEAQAMFEASIDFTDEGLPDGLEDMARSGVASLLAEVEAELSSARGAAAVREGFEVVLLGAPNAGKSTLLNAIAGRRVAITSPVAGTTRDTVECRTDLDGLPVVFVDTAGLRDSVDAIEAEGVEMAWRRAASADLVLHVMSFDAPSALPPMDHRLPVWNKSDVHQGPGLSVSAATGVGIDLLLSEVARRLGEKASVGSVFARERHRVALETAAAALFQASAVDAELAIAHLQDAAAALDDLVGRIDAEEVLGEIFGRFCIGK